MLICCYHFVFTQNILSSFPSIFHCASLSELKVTPSFCFPFKIPDDPTATSMYCFDDLRKLELVSRKHFFAYHLSGIYLYGILKIEIQHKLFQLILMRFFIKVCFKYHWFYHWYQFLKLNGHFLEIFQQKFSWVSIKKQRT